jgi:hypothetical protein
MRPHVLCIKHINSLESFRYGVCACPCSADVDFGARSSSHTVQADAAVVHSSCFNSVLPVCMYAGADWGWGLPRHS